MNCRFDAIAQLHQYLDDRLTSERPDLLECYLNGRIGRHFEFGVRGPSKWDPVDLDAIFDSPRILNANELSLAADHGRRKLNSELWVRAVIFGNDKSVTHNQSMGDDHQEPVLVCNVEIMNDLQN